MLCLTKYTVSGPSSRYRVHQFLPFLAKAGVEVRIQSLHDAAYLERLFASRRPSFAYLAKRGLGRAASLLKARRYDVIFVQKEIFPSFPGIAEWMLDAAGARLVMDIDDAIFTQYDDDARGLRSRALRGKVPGVLRRSSLVLAGNGYLKTYAEKYAGKVVLFPTVVDTDKFRPVAGRPASSTPVCGWIGTPGTAKYLEALMPVLEPLAKTDPFTLKLIGAGAIGAPGMRVERLAWSEDTEVRDLSGIDIGLMPQDSSEWAKGKCGLKLLQYMSLGVPSVSSPSGTAGEIIVDGDNGFLAETPDEWRDKLQRLMRDRDLARRMGQRARAWVEENYSLRKYGPILPALLLDVARQDAQKGS
jgi:glycosyltransferase involved in cell wall biosynthesis